MVAVDGSGEGVCGNGDAASTPDAEDPDARAFDGKSAEIVALVDSDEEREWRGGRGPVRRLVRAGDGAGGDGVGSCGRGDRLCLSAVDADGCTVGSDLACADAGVSGATDEYTQQLQRHVLE